MLAHFIKAYIRLLSDVTVSTSSTGFPSESRAESTKLKQGTGDERKAQVGYDGNERIPGVFFSLRAIPSP